MSINLQSEIDKRRHNRLNFSQYSKRLVGGVDTRRSKPLREVTELVQSYLLKNHSELLQTTTKTTTLKNEIRSIVNQFILSNDLRLEGYSHRLLVQTVADFIAGYGPLEPLLKDESVTEIMVNGKDQVFVERYGKLERTNVRFHSYKSLLNVIQRIAARVGRRINESKPYLDARLEDGSRVNCTLPPISPHSATITIRKHRPRSFTEQELTASGTCSPAILRFLKIAVEGKLNIVISGATSSGKTALLRFLASLIPQDERLITIEDTLELSIKRTNIVALEAVEDCSTYDLLVNALRMRPDRVIVGEVRDREAFTLLEAMSTGHEGSLTTVHANDPFMDTVTRLARLMLRAGYKINMTQLVSQVASTIDLIIYVRRFSDGSRRVTNVVELCISRGKPKFRELFTYVSGPQGEGHVQKDAPSSRLESVVASRSRGMVTFTGMSR